MTSLEGLVAYHEDMCNNARKLVSERGKEYSTDMDTLSTFKTVSEILGFAPSIVAYTLLCVKMARLKNIMLNDRPYTDDTIYDLINYAIYVSDLHKGEQGI